MDIIKQPSANLRIHFFRNTNNPDWFFVKQFYDESAESFYLCSRHLPPHENSGYEDLSIEWAFALELNGTNTEKYLQFIRSVKGTRHNNRELREDSWIGINGWYEFADIKNTDKWLDDFYEFQKRSYEELKKANEIGKQINLF
jgi:hypothetical protein